MPRRPTMQSNLAFPQTSIPASFTWEPPEIFIFTFNKLLFAHLFSTPGSGFQCAIHCHFQVDVAIFETISRRRNAKQPWRGGEREKPPLASTFTRPKSAKVEKRRAVRRVSSVEEFKLRVFLSNALKMQLLSSFLDAGLMIFDC